jgi:hypothetical protein
MTNDEIELLADIQTAEKQIAAGEVVDHADAKSMLRRGFERITNDQLTSIANDVFLTYDELEKPE